MGERKINKMVYKTQNRALFGYVKIFDEFVSLEMDSDRQSEIDIFDKTNRKFLGERVKKSFSIK